MCESCTSEFVDRAVMAEVHASIGAGAVDDLLRSFFGEAERRIAALRALNVDRTESIRFQLHSLHGAAGMFGLARLSALVSKLYRNADAITPERYLPALDDIARTLTASREALAELH